MGSQVMEIIVWVLSIVIVSTFLGMVFQVLRGMFDGYMDRWEEKYLVNKKAEYLEDENILSVNDPLSGERKLMMKMIHLMIQMYWIFWNVQMNKALGMSSMISLILLVV